MTSAYAELGLSSDADDAAIRERYLELVRTHPPDRDPERFKAIRAAYDELKDPETRLRRRLFEFGSRDGLAGVIAEVEKGAARPRVGLRALLEMSKRS
jgi:curved DNA-binding protein CbpA